MQNLACPTWQRASPECVNVSWGTLRSEVNCHRHPWSGCSAVSLTLHSSKQTETLQPRWSQARAWEALQQPAVVQARAETQTASPLIASAQNARHGGAHMSLPSLTSILASQKA